MPRNPFEQGKVDTESETGIPAKMATCSAIGHHKARKGEHESAKEEHNTMAYRKEAGKGHNSVEGLVGPETN